MGSMCQQRQYEQLQSSKKNKSRNDFGIYNKPKTTMTLNAHQDDFKIDFGQEKKYQNPFKFYEEKKKQQEDLKFEKFFQEQNRKKLEEDKKFEKFFEEQNRKKLEEDKKFQALMKKMETQKKLQPYQTDMAKVLYAYMRLYGRSIDEDTKKFVQENYSRDYCSLVYKLNQSSPRYTYKYEVLDRLKVAKQNNMISDHQRFTKADEKNRTIEYDWTIRHQLTNHRTVYQCQATFDQQNRFLKITMRQTDRYNYRPKPQVQKPKQSKPSWDTSPSNNYAPPPTDWGAYYNAETQKSQQQLREKLNRQAQQWNEYARQRQRLARGY